jgi:hypothetical protein
MHSDVWEEPCRVGEPEELQPSYEIRTGKEQFILWKAVKALMEKFDCNLFTTFCKELCECSTTDYIKECWPYLIAAIVLVLLLVVFLQLVMFLPT